MPSWKKLVVSGSDATLNSLSVTQNVTAAEFSGSFSGSFQGDGSALTGITSEIDIVKKFTSQFTLQSSVTVNHFLDSEYPFVQVYDSDNEVLVPQTVKSLGPNSIRVDFSENRSGFIVIAKGGYLVSDFTEEFTNVSTVTVNHSLGEDLPFVQVFGTDNQLFVPQTIAVLNNNNIQVDFSSNLSGVVAVSRGGYTIFDLINAGDVKAFINQDVITLNCSSFSEFPFTQVYESGSNEQIIPLGITKITPTTVQITFSSPIDGFISFPRTGHIIDNTSRLDGQPGSFYLDFDNFTNIPPSGDNFPFTGSAIITGSLNVIGPISSSGDLVPTTSTQDLGTVTNPWRELYVSTGSINFSDGTQTIKTLTADNLITSESLTGILSSIQELTTSTGSTDLILQSLQTESGSIRTDFNSFTGSAEQRLDSLQAYTSSLNTALSFNGANVTILGNLEVVGTTTTIDSTTVDIGTNIIDLNGTGAVSAGLRVKDITAPNTVSGSFLWNSTTDRWIAGPLDSESNILLALGDSVVSGSSQIFYSGITNIPSGIISSSGQLNDSTLEGMNISGSFSGSFQGDGSGLTGVPFNFGQAASFSTVFTSQTTITIGHELNTELPLVQVYDTSNELFVPETVKVIDENTVRIDFSETSSGKVVVAKGGHIIQGTNENASLLNGESGSFYLDFNNFTNIPPSGDSFPYTGSAIITGSFEVQGTTFLSGTISASGNFVPSVSELFDLGSPDLRWKDLYLSGSTIFLGTTKLTTNETGDVEFKDVETNSLRKIRVEELEIGTGENRRNIKVDESGNIKFMDRQNSDRTLQGLGLSNIITTDNLAQHTSPSTTPSTFQLLNQVSGPILVNIDLGPLIDITLNGNIELSFTASIAEDQFKDFTLIVRGLNEFNLSTDGISLEPPGGVSSSSKERNLIKGQFLGNGTVFYNDIRKLEDREEIYADSEYVIGGYY